MTDPGAALRQKQFEAVRDVIFAAFTKGRIRFSQHDDGSEESFLADEILRALDDTAPAPPPAPSVEDATVAAPPASGRLWHSDGDECIGIHCGNPEHGYAAEGEGT